MSDLAGHLFVLGIALLAVPITAFLGPVVTSLLGLMCLIAAIGVYRGADSALSSFDGAAATERTNCPSCGARVAVDDACEHCGTDLSSSP